VSHQRDLGAVISTWTLYYLQLDETEIADGVFDKIQSGRRPKQREPKTDQGTGQER
jgi:hypothetical protein